MFEKFNQLAEQAATSASRRQFLGRVGRGAMTAAVVVGGLVVLSAEARAGRGTGAKRCGGQICPPGYNYCCSFLDHGAGKRVHYCSVSRCTHPS